MKVTLIAQLRHLCPFIDEVDDGEIQVTYEQEPTGPLLELHDLRAIFDTYEDTKISHEELTAEVAFRLVGRAETVTTRWRTADIDVQIEAW